MVAILSRPQCVNTLYQHWFYAGNNTIHSLFESYRCWVYIDISMHSLVTLYRKTSNIGRTLVGNLIVDNSDVVGASPVGAAPTTSSFWT